jgi:hypothetical protein
VIRNQYVTFGDNKKGKVLDTGVIMVNNNFTLKDVKDRRRRPEGGVNVSQSKFLDGT